MPAKSPVSPQQDQQLFTALLDPTVADDPYNFVMFAFPWGKPNTPLARQTGPRKWQARILRKIAAHIKEQKRRGTYSLDPEIFRHATVSGRGIGKSALLAWLALWLISTRFGSSVIIAANSEDQLKNKTFAEIGKWHTLAINEHWFDRNTLTIKPSAWFEGLLKSQLKVDTTYYYVQGQLWTEERPDAFAGAHNFAGIMVLFDEASGIPSPIWKVTEGFFTEPIEDRYWLVFSNGRRNTGAFFECFHKNRDFWIREHIDSRDVEGTDASIYASIIHQYGEDSDEARVEVKGQFPRTGDRQFIGREVVDEACKREFAPDFGAPLVMGVDVARFGDDHSVVFFRRGRDARSLPYKRWKALDTVQLSQRVAELADKHRPDAIFVDGGGVGGGVVDRLKEMRYRVIEVQFGSRADEPDRYMRKRDEIWGRVREWLLTGCLPDDGDLADDLVTPEYKITLNGQIQMESKEEMKKRGHASPDIADALALTFASAVARLDAPVSRKRERRAGGVDFPLFG